MIFFSDVFLVFFIFNVCYFILAASACVHAIKSDVFRKVLPTLSDTFTYSLWNSVQIISTYVESNEWIKMYEKYMSLQNNTSAAVVVVHLHFEISSCHHFRLMQACTDTVWGHDETEGPSCFCFTDFCFPFQNKTFIQAVTLWGYTAAFCQSPPSVKSTWEWKQRFFKLFILWHAQQLQWSRQVKWEIRKR